MSKQINENNLLMDIKIEDPVIIMPNKKDINQENNIFDTSNMTPEEEYLVNGNKIELDQQERDSLSNTNSLIEQDRQEMQSEINKIVKYHTTLLSQRYGKEAVEDYLKNNPYKI